MDIELVKRSGLRYDSAKRVSPTDGDMHFFVTSVKGLSTRAEKNFDRENSPRSREHGDTNGAERARLVG
jgi:hypothetical protein